MKKQCILVISIIFCICMNTACQAPQAKKQTDSILPIMHYGNLPEYQESRKILAAFIDKKLSGEDGIYTNLIETEQDGSAASGHEVLSESFGLMMRIYVIAGDELNFIETWTLARKMLDLNSGFSYRYSPLLQKQYKLNAAVDDLRIIRALYEAGERFDNPQYIKEAEFYAKRFYQFNIIKGQQYDFYDENAKKTNDFITLCYIDLKTLNLLPISAKVKQSLKTTMLKIVRNGYLSDTFPFYETRFHYGLNHYTSENINTVESLLTILELVEVGEHKTQSISFIKEKLKVGALYGQYNNEGKPTTDIQSTAIYAIAAIIGSQLGDATLYKDSIKRMNEYQIKDTTHPLYGGFADTLTQQAYSFDNLYAMLAYAY